MTALAKESLYNVLRAPMLTEKSTRLADKFNQVVFEVEMSADKKQVKAAVEFLFQVEVLDVRIAKIKGKTRVFRQVRGKRSDYKKAYVKLKEGHDISFVGKE